MKIAFVGKGGSGKTTLSSLFSHYLASSGLPVVAIDADINQHLGAALDPDSIDPAGGTPGSEGGDKAAAPPALGSHLTEIKDYLRGTNPRIDSAASMVKTTPPGRGSRLLRPGGEDLLHGRFARQVNGVDLMVTGPFSEDDLGVACYHSKVGAVELYLNHLVDGPGEYVVVDMTAGADSFASGLFTRFDMTFLVVEPTRKGVSVYRQYQSYAADHGVAVAVVGNKVQGTDDVAFLREHVGDDLAVCLEHSGYVRAMEKGRAPAFSELEERNRTGLARLRDTVDALSKDWAKYTRQAVEFHVKNARRWANAATGEDLTGQVDPEFVLGPDALTAR